MNDETNGSIDMKDVRKLARGASTLRRLGSLLGGRRRRSVRRSAPRRSRRSRSARTGTTVGASWKALLVFAVTLFVWWLADGGAKTCADAFRRTREPASAETAKPASPAPAAPAEKPAGAKSAGKKAAAGAPASPEVLTDGLWWEGRGVVEKVLPDDTTPPRHQRFLLRDDRGRSLFFAHNIEEAPRVPDLREGDELSFRGEWRDNEMGGAMHWTHRAGNGRRKGGWIERDGVRYE